VSKSKRLKPEPLASVPEFLETVVALTTLEALKRKIEAERDAELIAVKARYDQRLAPVLTEIKGRLALAEAYAEAHRKELLPPKAKSALYGLARFGWREGNRTVATLRRDLTAEQVIASLKAIGLGDYVRTTEEIARAKLLADCRNDKTIAIVAQTARGPRRRHIALARAGLKITQGENFFVEPTSDAAETMKTEAA
jgi:phage host-nuclease inhibitor protein Gam